MKSLIFLPSTIKVIGISNQNNIVEEIKNNITDKISITIQELKHENSNAVPYNNQVNKDDQLEEINNLKNIKQFLQKKNQEIEATLNNYKLELNILKSELKTETNQKKELLENYTKLKTSNEEINDNIKELNIKYNKIIEEKNTYIDRFYIIL